MIELTYPDSTTKRVVRDEDPAIMRESSHAWLPRSI